MACSRGTETKPKLDENINMNRNAHNANLQLDKYKKLEMKEAGGRLVKRGAFKDIQNQNALNDMNTRHGLLAGKLPFLDEKKGSMISADMGKFHVARLEASIPSAILKREVVNQDDPYQYGEYLHDVYGYLRIKERSGLVSDSFVSKQRDITDKMRSMLVDWLAQVQERFNMIQETLFISVQLLDRFLEKKQVKKSELQLVGITCLFIASKYEEQRCIEIRDCVYVTDESCESCQIREMECLVLNTLSFDLSPPISLVFLRRFTRACSVNHKTHSLAKYFLELYLTDSLASSCLSSFVAAASLCLAVHVMKDVTWGEFHEANCGYTKIELHNLMKRVVFIMRRNEESGLMAAQTKYAKNSTHCVGVLETLSSKDFREFRCL